jgi:hypothetical protein
MNDLSQDPIINVVHNGIKEGIRASLENKSNAATVILVLCGIDAMAFLNMPESQQNVKGEDFIEWADRYIKFPCKEQLTGKDLYGARCGMLHQYGTESNCSRNKTCRRILYSDDMVPEVRYNPEIDENLVIVSIKALVDAFFQGIDKFLIDLFSIKEKAQIAEERFQIMLHTLPYDPSEISTNLLS